MKKKKNNADPEQLPAFADEKNDVLNAIVETPKGSRSKYAFDPQHQLFKLKTLLPMGDVFPFDFGFVPSTTAEDGDPIDVLILMDEPVAVGTLIDVRLVGVIEAEQTEKKDDGKQTTRNDRLIAVSHLTYDYSEVRSLNDLNDHLVDDIEHFFISYNEAHGKKFKVLGRHGSKRALDLVREAEKRKRKEQKGSQAKKAA